MHKYLILCALGTLLLLAGCRTRYMNFDIPLAPATPVSEEIQTVLLVDRTAATDRRGERIEGILTGEGFDQDVQNKQLCLRGIADELRNSGRFRFVYADEVLEGGKRGEVQPPPLPFDRVQQLCEAYGTDALLAMEAYDSDFVLTHGTRISEGLSFYAEGVATVDVLFRMYDGAYQEIIDEESLSHRMQWSAGGNSIQDAIAAILNKNDAIRAISQEAGALYARQFSGSVFRASRVYYNRGDPQLQYGARLMEANDWDRAIQVLEEIVNNPGYKRRDRGFAAHNLAVIYEVLGDIPRAKEWAGRAWSEFQNKPSRDYIYVLNRRG